MATIAWAQHRGASRRQFLRTAAAVVASTALKPRTAAAQDQGAAIKAGTFDAFAIFDPRPVFRLADQLFPDRGNDLSEQWREAVRVYLVAQLQGPLRGFLAGTPGCSGLCGQTDTVDHREPQP